MRTKRRRRPSRPGRHARQAAAAALIVALLAGGCEEGGRGPLDTIMDDLAAPFENESPGKTARDLFDVTDADNRRRAVSLFSAAPYGGEDTYVRAYRLLLGGDTVDSKPKIVGAPDPDATVRGASVKALGLHGTVDDVVLIIPRLDDKVAFVRWEAAKSLGRIHNPEAMRPLLRKLHEDRSFAAAPDRKKSMGEPDPDVRQASAAALGQYASPAVFDALVAALDDSQFKVAHSARCSLTTLTGYDLGPEPGDWLAWAKRNRDALFADQQVYTWQPYETPHGFIEKVQFWKTSKPVPSRVPTGMKVSTVQ